jgi:Domain of unknown function (DUF4157)
MLHAVNAAIAAGLANTSLPIDAAFLTPMPSAMQSLLRGRATAITLGKVIFILPDRFDRVVAGDDAELLAHELIHVRQWADDGVRRFLTRYVSDYLRLRCWGLDHDRAYRHIRYEWEAYAGSRHIVAHL